MKKRILWIDYAKSITIFFVIIIHTHCDAELTKALKAFVMPLFFLISGYLFSYDNNPKTSTFLKKRARQLLVPYLWINIIAYVAWITVLRHYGSDATSQIEWHSPLIGILTGTGPMLVHDIPLWSLVSFFIVEIVYYPIGKIIKRPWIVAAVFFAVLYILTYMLEDNVGMLPYAIGPSIAGVAFYSLGRQCRISASGAKTDRKDNLACLSGCLVLSTIIYLFAFNDNEEISFYVIHYGNMPLFIIAALSGAAMTVCVSKLLSYVFGECKFIRFVSSGTLIICGFHLLALAFIKGIALFILKINPDSLTDGIASGMLSSAAAFAITLPIVYIVRKYFKFLVDK